LGNSTGGEVRVCDIDAFEESATYGNDLGEEDDSTKSPAPERLALVDHPEGSKGGAEESK